MRKPVARKPANLRLYQIKFAWNCPHCKNFNICDTAKAIEEMVVNCMGCGRTRKGIVRDRWYEFPKLVKKKRRKDNVNSKNTSKKQTTKSKLRSG